MASPIDRPRKTGVRFSSSALGKKKKIRLADARRLMAQSPASLGLFAKEKINAITKSNKDNQITLIVSEYKR